MRVTIRDVKVICCAPQKINLVTVKVETSEPGLYGVGCATFAHRHLAVVAAVEKYLKPYLIGRAVSDIEDIWQSIKGMSYWRNGPVLNNALSGVDMALWDIKGEMAGMPLYDLLGGKCRTGVPCYTHAEGTTIEDCVQKVGALKKRGYRCIRAQVGGYGGKDMPYQPPEGSFEGCYYDPKAYMAKTIELFERLRETYGWELELCHDVHERLRPSDAVIFAKDMEKFRLFFLEDCLSPEQSGWFKQIRQHCTTPLAMGELFNNPNEWLNLITEREIDYIRIHLSQIGGITPARKLIALCDAFGIRTAWHGPIDLTPIGHAVNIHLDMASPNFGIQEWADTNTLSEDAGAIALHQIFTGIPEMRDGYLYLNGKPGIGVDIDEKAAAEYPCSEEVVTWDWMLPRLPDGTAVRP